MYEYKCEVDRVVDADTVDVIIDWGFSIFHKARVRMYGIDTPESRTRDKDEKARGLMSKDFLSNMLKKGDVIIKDMVKEYDDADTKEVINRFFDYVDTYVWCTVRSDNIRACKFYEKVGMERVADIDWKKGELKGYVYLRKKYSLETFMT